jgi:hypothetical protein
VVAVAAGAGGRSAGADFVAVGVGTGGGACCFCHASHRRSAENEKMTNRNETLGIHDASVTAREQAGAGAETGFESGNGS